MKKYGIMVSIIAFALALQAQSPISDSLRDAIRNSPDDSSKVKKLINASLYLPYSNSDSALFYADSIIRSSGKIDFSFGTSYGYGIKAAAYATQGDFARALYFNNLNRRLLEELNDQLRIAGWHAELANIFSELGDHREALIQSSIARQLVYSLGDSAYDRRIEKYISIRERKSSRDFEHAKLLLAANMLDSALIYGQRAVEMSKGTDWYDWSGFPVLLGDIYTARGDFQAALLSYNRKTSVNIALDSGKNFVGKAAVFVKIDQQDSSSIYARKALDIFQRIHYSKGVMQASELLSGIYEKTNPQESIKFYKISIAIKDSLYSKERVSQLNSIFFNEELRKLDALAAETAARNKFRIWSLLGISFTLLVTGLLLWRNTHHKKAANIQLRKEKQTVEETLEKLKSTQSQLIQSEKMASLGELTAGIAHEIQNPLNFVNNFSEVNRELVDEMQQELKAGKIDDALAISNDIKDNEEKINHHGKRADAIVKGMLQHSRSSSGVKEPTDINALADEYLRLSYHGLRAKDKSFNATLKTGFDETIGTINIVPQDIGRVILNLINNAFYAVTEKKKSLDLSGFKNLTGLEDMPSGKAAYEPTVTVTTKKSNDKVLISVKDNGNGIPQKALDKIFQPFFTTKPTGQGTGLGLSLSYDIVKAHGGELNVETTIDEGSTFRIVLPHSLN